MEIISYAKKSFKKIILDERNSLIAKYLSNRIVIPN